MRTACPDPQGLPSMCWRACGLTRRLMCARSARPASCRRPGHGRPLGRDRNGCTRTTTRWPPRRIQARRSKAYGRGATAALAAVNTAAGSNQRRDTGFSSQRARAGRRAKPCCAYAQRAMTWSRISNQQVHAGNRRRPIRPGTSHLRIATAREAGQPSRTAGPWMSGHAQPVRPGAVKGRTPGQTGHRHDPPHPDADAPTVPASWRRHSAGVAA